MRLAALCMLAALALSAARVVIAGGNIAKVQSGVEPLTKSTAEQSVKICVIPDTQNYCTSDVGPASPGNPTAAELAEGPRQLDILAADIISEQPDFCIHVGDIGDQAGSNIADSSDVDNFLLNPAKYAEYTCQKEHLFDKLDAAGIPWIADSGNHESYKDFERAFPRAAFLRRSYAIAAQNEVNRWHAGYNDTEERAALFPTGIGPICVVTGDYTLDPAGGTLDIDFITNHVGCGGDYLTLYSSHAGNSGTLLNSSVNRRILMDVYGHFISGALEVYEVVVDGGFPVLLLYTNGQEASLSCGIDVAQLERRIHTGVGNWTVAQIIPSLNRIAIQTRNALTHSWQNHPCNYASVGYAGNPALPLCTRFPSLGGCDQSLLPDGTGPTAPANLAAPELAETSIGLTWTGSTDALGVVQYLIERCVGAACSPSVEVGAVPDGSLAFTSTGMAIATTYGFRVRARDGSGNNSNYSSTVYAATIPDVTPPTTPTLTSVTASGSTSIRIIWSIASDAAGINHYELERCVGVGCSGFAALATIDFGYPRLYIDSDSIVSGDSYSYRVRAVDNTGLNSSYSATGTLVFP